LEIPVYGIAFRLVFISNLFFYLLRCFLLIIIATICFSLLLLSTSMKLQQYVFNIFVYQKIMLAYELLFFSEYYLYQ